MNVNRSVFCGILIILLIPYTAGGTTGFHSISSNIDSSRISLDEATYDNSEVHNSSVKLVEQLEGTAQYHNNIPMGQGMDYQFQGIEYPNTINFSLEDPYEDALKYRTNFSSTLEDGAGSLDPIYDEISDTTTIEHIGLVGPHDYVSGQSLTVPADSFLNISISNIDFQFNESSLGHFGVAFEFAELTIKVYFRISETFRGVQKQENGTKETYIFFADDTYQQEVYPKDLPTDLPITELNLKQITFFSYYNDTYNLSVEFNQISIMGPISTLKLVEPNLPSNTLSHSIQLEVKEKLAIGLPENIQANLVWTRIYKIKHQVELRIERELQGLVAYGIFDAVPTVGNFTSYLNLEKHFAPIRNSTVSFNSSHIWYQDQGNALQSVFGDLVSHSREPPNFNPVQGQNISLPWDNSSYNQILIYHQPSSEMRYFRVDVEQASIPSHWSKGTVEIYLLEKTGNYTRWDKELTLTPVQLVSENSFNFTRATRQHIPIKLQNLTSGQEFTPLQLITWFKNRTWKVEGSYGIIIEAGDLHVGYNVITVQALDEGYAPLKFQLHLFVSEIEFKPQLSYEHHSKSKTTVDITLPTAEQWTVGINITAITDTFSISRYSTHSRSTIVLNGSMWDTSHRNHITIKFSLDDHLGNYSTELTMEPYHGDGNIPSGLIFTVISLSGIAGSASYKVYQMRSSKDTIRF